MDSAYNDSTGSSEPLASHRSPAAVEADNLIRRRLRVSDPYAATDVAQGLRRLFRSDDEALKREASGLPIVALPRVPTAPAANGPSSAELEQATDDVERDLKALTTNALLKDIEAELDGWGQELRSVIADGTSAAQLALDPSARARAFGARRRLGEYARLARFMGATTPQLNMQYRRLAQSLDEVAALIPVLMGEGLARLGTTGGRFLLQAPVADLQSRRDAVLSGLRALLGAADYTHRPDDWPRGIVAVQQLLLRLEQSGYGDLRALLNENTLARALDDLIDRAASMNARGLRALAATAPFALGQLQRLVNAGSGLVGAGGIDPESPPLATFLFSLQLFLDAFASPNSQRVLMIARPPLLAYGLYGLGELDAATLRLQMIILRRNRLANLLDCYLRCGCEPADVQCQAVLDKILFDVDRAVDFYAQGSAANGDGEPEQRAAAFGILIQQFLAAPQQCLVKRPAALGQLLQGLADDLVTAVAAAPLTGPTDPRSIVMRDELCAQRSTEDRWLALVRGLTPGCADLDAIRSRLEALIDGAITSLGFGSGACPPSVLSIPPHEATTLAAENFGRFTNGFQP